MRVLRAYVFQDDVVSSHVSISNASQGPKFEISRVPAVCVHICALPLDAKDLTSALEIVLTLDLGTVDPTLVSVSVNVSLHSLTEISRP